MNEPVRYVTPAEVVAYHHAALEAQGHTQTAVANPERLLAALARPATTAFESDAFPTLTEKAAVLLHGIVTGHPFVDGNKRAGLGALLLFLELNGVATAADPEALYQLVMAVASDELRDVPAIAARLGAIFEFDDRGAR